MSKARAHSWRLELGEQAEQCEVAADRWALQQKQVTREPTPQGDGRVHTEGQRLISCLSPLGPRGDMRTGRECAGG